MSRYHKQIPTLDSDVYYAAVARLVPCPSCFQPAGRKCVSEHDHNKGEEQYHPHASRKTAYDYLEQYFGMFQQDGWLGLSQYDQIFAGTQELQRVLALRDHWLTLDEQAQEFAKGLTEVIEG